MKYDPVSLFDIKIYRDRDAAIDIAPSRQLLEHCTKRLDEADSDSMSDDEIYKVMAAAIIEYAFKTGRKN